jgi:hypothetical protein
VGIKVESITTFPPLARDLLVRCLDDVLSGQSYEVAHDGRLDVNLRFPHVLRIVPSSDCLPSIAGPTIALQPRAIMSQWPVGCKRLLDGLFEGARSFRNARESRRLRMTREAARGDANRGETRTVNKGNTPAVRRGDRMARMVA